MFSKCALLLVVLLSIAGISLTGADRYLDKLAKDLTSNYVNIVNPGNLTLKFGVGYMQARFDRATKVLSSYVWERYAWTDPRLTWRPSSYGGIEMIRLPAKLLWTPDIKLYNPYLEPELREDVLAVIWSNGSVVWVPPARYTTKCTTNSSATLDCNFKLGSWTMDGFAMKLEMQPGQTDDMDMSSYVGYVASDGFQLTKNSAKITTVYYACCEEPWVSYEVAIQIRLQR